VKYPLGIVVLLYMGGLWFAELFQPPLPLLFAASIAIAVFAIFVPRMRRVLLPPLIVLTGWTNMAWHTAVISPNDLRVLFNGGYEDVSVRGKLLDTPSARPSSREPDSIARTLTELDVTEVRKADQWQPATGRIMVFTTGPMDSQYFKGQPVEVRGICSFPPLPIAEGLFDYRRHLARQGIYFQLRASSSNDWQLLEPHLTTPPLSDRFLAWAQATMSRGLPETDESLRLLWAMVLGWRSALTNEVYLPFMESGTMHIFAISGLHIALIAGILVALLRVAQVSRLWCGVVVIPLIWFYTGATGWQPSAIRSTIMMSIIVGGWALKRPCNLVNSLATAALIILLWQPQQLFQAGFQLSFFVVLSIALFVPPLENLRDRLLRTDPMRPEELMPRWQRAARTGLRWLMTGSAVSIAAWLGSWPLTAHYFHLFSPVTLLANLLVVPLASAALAASLGSLICGSWFAAASELFNHAGWLLMTLMVRISQWAADLPGAYFHVQSPAALDFVVYYALLFGALSGWLFAAKNRAKAVTSVGIVAILYLLRWNNAGNSLTVTVIPLKGGSAVFCDAPGSENDLLVDCGNTNSVEFVMKPFLQSHGVNILPRLLLTHGDLRNVGGTEPLCAALHVVEIVTTSVRFRSPTYRRILRELPHRPESWIAVNRGDIISGWTVLHPAENDSYPQADDSAVVLMGEFGGTRVLLLSDLGRPGQRTLLDRSGDLHADIVVSGLPEQGEPLSDALLDAVQPKVIVVVDSERPATRRAKPALRGRLQKRGIPVLFTRDCGAATIEVARNGWVVKTVDSRRITPDSKPPGPQSTVETDDADAGRTSPAEP
jgi:competence protein ComEC